MKKIFFLILVLSAFLMINAETIWQEDFTGYTAGTGINGYGNIGDYPSSVNKWTLDTSNASLTGTSDYIKTRSGRMEARDTDGDAVWMSQAIDISGYTDVSFSLTVSETGDLESADYTNVYYSVNGSSYNLIQNWDNLGTSSHTLVGDKPNDDDWQSKVITISDIDANTLRIKVAMKINAGTEYIQIDDIIVEGTVATNDYYASISPSLTGDALKSALHNLIKGHTEYTYNSTASNNIMMEADEDPNNSNNLIEIYTGDSENYISSREHVWAKSHGDFGTSKPTGADLHNLKPSQKNVNSARGSKDYDNGGTEVSSAPGNYSDSNSWEPRDEVKGDVARILFYMAVRYEGDAPNEPDLELVNGVNTKDNTISGEYGEIGNLSAILQWSIDDPVDEFEMHRNNVIYNYQHNRNPFIDHPEWISKIWSASSGDASVIISEICDPKYNYRDNRFIEICNVGDGSQDLTGWKVVAIANGSEAHTWNLYGTMDAGDVFTVGTNSADVTIDYQSSGWFSDNRYWNGGSNDGAKLVDANGNVTDIIVANSYLFNDKTLCRNSDILDPSGNTTELSEWTATSAHYASNGTPGTHIYGRIPEDNTPVTYITGSIRNYPNPFNPSTNIEFSVNKNSANADVSIYNIKGQKITTIYNGTINKNRVYNYTWNGTGSSGKIVSSGVYFIRLSVDNYNNIKRVILMK